MNFLSKTISTLTGSSIPYKIKDEIANPKSNIFPYNRMVWTVYSGENPKQNQAPVSIFEFNLKDPENLSKGHDLLARSSFKKLKLVKYPGIVNVIDFIENDNFLYIVTEPVEILHSYLVKNKDRINQDVKIFGIYKIGKTLEFLNQSANYLHGNLDLFSSVFVDSTGNWKLLGFELATNLTSDPDQPFYRLSSRMPGFDESVPPEISERGIESIRQFPIKLDSYKFGIFVYLILSNTDFSLVTSNSVSQSKLASSRLPRQLTGAFKSLVHTNQSARSTVPKFMGSTESFFQSNLLIRFDWHLDEAKFKINEDKLEFFKTELSALLDENEEFQFPPGLLENKLLPELISLFKQLTSSNNSSPVTQETAGKLLNYILKFGSSVDASSFDKILKPVVLQAYALPDRTVRLTLLSYLSYYGPYLSDEDVQQKLFNNIIGGFQDSNFVIRETTLKSITEIINKVSVKQVNQDLLKILAKSQMDPKPSIRVNTLVLIIRISDKIYKNSRNNVLITALSKSLRETFTPCKLTALSGFESMIDQFSLDEICGKILGHLAISLMDRESKKVRDEAKRVFYLYFQHVEEHSDKLPVEEADDELEEKQFMERYAPVVSTEVQATTSKAQTSFGWNIVNKLVSSSSVEGALNKEFNTSTPDLSHVTTPSEKVAPTINDFENFDVDLDDNWDTEVDDEPKAGNLLDTLSIQEERAPSQIRAPTLGSTASKRPAPRTDRKNSFQSTARSAKSNGLKLGNKPTKKPISKLNLVVDDTEEDNWDGDW